MLDHNLMKIQCNLFDTIYPITGPFIANGFKYFLIISFTKFCNFFVAILLLWLLLLLLLLLNFSILGFGWEIFTYPGM